MRKYTSLILVGLVIPLALSSCWKKETIVTPPTSLTSTGSPYTFEQIKTLFDEKEKRGFDVNTGSIGEMSSYLQSGRRNIREIIQSLSGSDSVTISKKAYLLSYLGDYEASFKEKDKLCKDASAITECSKKSIILDIKTPVDQSGNALISPNLYLDTYPLEAESAIVEAEVYPDMIHRLRMEKEGYLDAYAGINTVNTDVNSVDIKPIMAKADQSIIIDNQVGGTYTVGEGSGSITYTISSDTFVDKNKKILQGDVNVYLFALGNDDNTLSAFNLDAFSTGGEVRGSSMLTSGMPFLTAYKDGLQVDTTKPIVGTGTIAQGIVIMDFQNVPKNQWLTNTELRPYKIPGFWSFNKESGVWTESRMQILDTQGGYKFEI